MRQKKQKGKASRIITDEKIEEGIRHCQEVYEAIISLQNKAKTEEIEQWIYSINKMKNETLELQANWKYNHPECLWTEKDKEDFIKQKWHHTLSKRTIERCIKKDKRIVKNGWYYSVDEESRFETRYLDPKDFGLQISTDAIYKKAFQYNDKGMFEMIKRFGAIVMYCFIEASRPFKDKKMSFTDRHDLVEYWAKNAIPIGQMFRAFKVVFNERLPERIHGNTSVPTKSYDEPSNEMEQVQIDECLLMLNKCCPDIYNDLAKHKKKSPAS